MRTSIVFKNSTILKILDYYKNIWALSYTSAVSHWDLETYMPKKGVVVRAEALGRLAVIRQKMFLDTNFVELIKKASKLNNLTDEEKGVVRVLERSLNFYQKLPKEFVEEFENLTNNATVIWREAKEKNDFKIFEKSLTKIFDMNREMSEYLGYSDSPYDALLDQYEEGLKSKDVNLFFEEIKLPLKSLLFKITASKKYQQTHFLENADYDKAKMEKLNSEIVQEFWQDLDSFRMDVSSHPFTTSFSKNDTRITTWYHQKNFARSLLATIHEFGHALYDMQSKNELEMTPIAGGSSLVVHESQSRFWENFVGRNDLFIKQHLKKFSNIVSKDLSFNDVYFYFNKVSPSLLRVEADEVTYHFHIMIRTEIEKGIIEGNIKVKDIPEIWNSKMKEYLGITSKEDSSGALQDIHWSGGSVGYFPTYSLGTFLGACWEEKIKESKINTTDYQEIGDWLKQNIHQFGSTYTLSDLLTKNKMQFKSDTNLKYLWEKYTKIYDL